MGKIAIKRMLFLNPGSPREQAAKNRNKVPQASGGSAEMTAEQKRRLRFVPAAKPKVK